MIRGYNTESPLIIFFYYLSPSSRPVAPTPRVIDSVPIARQFGVSAVAKACLPISDCSIMPQSVTVPTFCILGTISCYSRERRQTFHNLITEFAQDGSRSLSRSTKIDKTEKPKPDLRFSYLDSFFSLPSLSRPTVVRAVGYCLPNNWTRLLNMTVRVRVSDMDCGSGQQPCRCRVI